MLGGYFYRIILMSEHAIQAAFIEWVRWQEGYNPVLKLSFSIPNGGARHASTANMLKAEGVRAGVPDWHLPIPMGGYNGLWIEFKFGKNKLSNAQKDFIEYLKYHKHKVCICYSTENAIKEVEEYLKYNEREK